MTTRAVLLIPTLLLCGFFAPACASMGTFQRAETLGRGNVEFAAEAFAWALSAPERTAVAPVLGVAARFGVSDGVDLGAHVWSSAGGQVEAKFALTPRTAPVRASLAPGAGGAANGSFFAHLPVLIGIPVSSGNELVFAPKVSFWGAINRGGLVHVVTAGGSLGLVVPIAAHVSVVPEATAMVAVHGGYAGVSEPGASIVHAGVGFLFGKTSGHDQAGGGTAPSETGEVEVLPFAP